MRSNSEPFASRGSCPLCFSLTDITSIALAETPRLTLHGPGWVTWSERAAPVADSAFNSSPVLSFSCSSRANVRGTIGRREHTSS